MANKYINLVNTIPKEFSQGVVFTIQESISDAQKISVPYGEKQQFKVDEKSGAWKISANINGVDTDSVTGILPTTVYVCGIKDWDEDLFDKKIKPDNITLIQSVPSAEDVLSRITTLLKQKKYSTVVESCLALADNFKSTADNLWFTLLEDTVNLLSSHIYKGFDNLEQLVFTLVMSVFDNEDSLSLTQKIQFLSHLSPPEMSPGNDKYTSWVEKNKLACNTIMASLVEVNTEIDPAFDKGDLPLLNSSSLDQEERELNDAKVFYYNKQVYYARVKMRLEKILTQYMAGINFHLKNEDSSQGQSIKIVASILPEDMFENRALDKFGIGERIELSIKDIDKVPKKERKRYRWSIAKGDGHLTKNYLGEATYVPSSSCQGVKLALSCCLPSGDIDVIDEQEIEYTAPTGATMQQQPNTGIKHTLNKWSVGFKGEIYLEPDNVSYANINFREGSVAAVATGWLSDWNGLEHEVGNAFTIDGNKVNGIDTVFSGEKSAPYGAGNFTWAIPWEYNVTGTTDWLSFTTANHVAEADDAGKATISKKGAGPFSKDANAASSDY